MMITLILWIRVVAYSHILKNHLVRVHKSVEAGRIVRMQREPLAKFCEGTRQILLRFMAEEFPRARQMSEGLPFIY